MMANIKRKSGAALCAAPECLFGKSLFVKTEDDSVTDNAA